jgi:oligosaccharide repeat unit polymerase
MTLAAEPALILVAGVAGAALLLALIARMTGDLLNAANLFSLVWVLNLVVCEVLPFDELRLQPATLAVVIAAWWVFLAGFLASCWFRWPMARGPAELDATRGKIALVVLVCLQLVAVALEVQQTLAPAGVGGLLGQLANFADLRTSGAISDVKLPSLWGLWRWDFNLYLPLAFLLRKSGALRRRWLVLTVAFAAVTAILRFTRAPLLDVITICVVGAWILRSSPRRPRRRPRWRLVGVGVALAGFAIVFAAMQGALARENTGVGRRPGEDLIPYVGGPMRAYQDVLQNGDWWKSGRIYSLDFLDFMVFKLGLGSSYEGTVRPWIEFGTTTNLYTYLDAFTIDGGVPGALFGSLMLGVGVGWLFTLVRRRASYFGMVMYSYSAYNCLMAGANNQFVQFGFFLTAVLAVVIAVAISAEPVGALRLVRQGPPEGR